MIVARHEVPGTAPPQKSRPVGYGMIVQVCAPIRMRYRAKQNRNDPQNALAASYTMSVSLLPCVRDWPLRRPFN
jgi:hypothetical protein